MELRDYDFSRCRYSPNAKTFTTNISKAIPEFKAYDGKKRKEIFQYIVCLYDKESPLWSKEPDYFQRKALAAELCGLSAETHGGSFNKFTTDILEGKNEDVNGMVAAYLAHTGNIEYTQLVVELHLYHSLLKRQLGGKMLDSTEYKTMQSLMENIQRRSRTLFGSGPDEELTNVKNRLYQIADQDRQRLQPEAVVKVIEEDGDLPADWNPYGKDYEVEPLKFAHNEEKGKTT